MNNKENDIAESIDFIIEHMATKTEMNERFDGVDKQFADVRLDIRSIRTDLDALIEKVNGITGYSKEIDGIMERLKIVEKHLGIGIGNKTAAA